MERHEADHQLWQHKPVRVRVEADAWLGVEPFLPDDLSVEPCEGGFEIVGTYGVDTFPDHRFVLLVDGELRTVLRWADIPDQIDNVIEFTPDPTHDRTFVFRFERGGTVVTHSHWVHHDMTPWTQRLRDLMTRETNGGWNARRDPKRRRRHPPLLGNGPLASVARRLLQRNPDLPSG